eukprot:TCONS_00014490-protein
MCADLCFVKEVLGKCSCTSLYGCFYCKKPIAEWDKNDAQTEELQTMSQISLDGQEAVRVLGANPKHDTAEFTKFQQSHFGQYAPLLLDCFEMMLLVPCGLHMILAHHRYLWNFLFDIIQDRKQQDLLPKALRSINCHFLALQIESYFKRQETLSAHIARPHCGLYEILVCTRIWLWML